MDHLELHGLHGLQRPSGLIILGGMLDGTSADLATGLESVAYAGGCFILATPSDNAMDDMNDNQGIWWLQMPGPVAGLTSLPTLGAGWTYEGWVVDTSGGAPMPFQLKPLAGMIAQGAGDGCVGNQTMATFPSGHAEVMTSVATEVSSWSGVKAVFE